MSDIYRAKDGHRQTLETLRILRYDGERRPESFQRHRCGVHTVNHDGARFRREDAIESLIKNVSHQCFRQTTKTHQCQATFPRSSPPHHTHPLSRRNPERNILEH